MVAVRWLRTSQSSWKAFDHGPEHRLQLLVDAFRLSSSSIRCR
jgi:hypothetical protein